MEKYKIENRKLKVYDYERKYSNSSELSMTNYNEKQKKSLIYLIKKMIYIILKKKNYNTKFNETCVDMLTFKDKEFKCSSVYNLWLLDYEIYTNMNLGSMNVFNSNFVRQMIIANGISEEELFEGTYESKTSNKIINKFNKRTFYSISKNMNELLNYLNEYSLICDYLSDKYSDEVHKKHDIDFFERCTTEELDKKDKSKRNIEQTILKIERTIIDEILLKKISKMDENQKYYVLTEYSKFVISEKKYFEEKTGFKYDKLSNIGDSKASKLVDELRMFTNTMY